MAKRKRPIKKAAKKKRPQAARIREAAAYQVFVCHATKDKWLAKTLCEKIEASGASTFRDDRDIAGGDDIPDEIRRELARSKELVILLTPDSAHRPWVLLEAGAFWGRKKSARIVPILCHASNDAIPELIKSKKRFMLNDFDNYLHELSIRVGKQS